MTGRPRPISASTTTAALPVADPRLAALAIALALAFVVIALWSARGFYNDDAFISLRYVQRLLAGHGLTWTDGERVEGFTNPLWVLETALLGASGMPLVAATRVLGVAYLAALLVLFLRTRVWPLTLPLLVTHPGLVVWTLGGLETVSFSFWLALGAWLSWRTVESPASGGTMRAIATGLAFALAGLTRPEGAGAGMLALALLMFLSRDRRRVVVAMAAFAIPLLAYLAFRVAFYGDVLPNAAYAKGSGLDFARHWQGALQYLERDAGEWAPAAACALAIFAGARDRRSGWIAALAAPLVLAMVFSAGDWMPAGRLLVPVFVLITLATGIAATTLRPGFRAPCAALLLLACSLQAAALFTMPRTLDIATAVGAPVGRYLERNLAAGSLIAVATAGSTPYYAPDLRFIDTLGLNDRHIARRPGGTVVTRLQLDSGHIKGDGAYVLARAPDVIVLGPAEGSLGLVPTAWFLTDYELLRSPGFHARYRPFTFAVPVSATEARSPRVRQLVDPSGRYLRFIAWLRLDSGAARDLAYRGHLLAAPWER